MKILIADTFEQAGLDGLARLGCQVVHEPDLKDGPLGEAILRTGCDVLIVRGTRVTGAMLERGERLSLVIRAGAGYNTIDVVAAAGRSIFVANCPGRNAAAVAELTWGLICALDRRIVDATVDLKAGRWDKKTYSKANGLKGRTLGIVGLGQIGRLVMERARAFQMQVVAYSRSLTAETAGQLGIDRADSIEDVAAGADVLTVHLAATDDTRGRINRVVFDAMKPGAIFVNVGRGELVDYDALLDAVRTKSIRVGLDVFESEPKTGVADFQDRVLQSGGIVAATPHIGASTRQAQEAIAQEAVRIVETFITTGEVRHCVNRAAESSAHSVLLVRHLNKPGVLAHVLESVSLEGINVEEMENIICAGGAAARARISLAGRLGPAALERIRHDNEHVLGITVREVPTV